MTRAAAAEAAAAAKQARLRALLDAAPPPRAPPPGSAEAALLADERWGSMRYTMLSYIANCTNGEDAVLASVSADSELQEQLLRTFSDLERTLESLEDLIETQPNALIFNRTPGDDPEPPAGTP